MSSASAPASSRSSRSLGRSTRAASRRRAATRPACGPTLAAPSSPRHCSTSWVHRRYPSAATRAAALH
eukprot:5422249-Prymnesium_polylepis.1